ncbi:sucrase ferredoxin [Nocardioides sp. LHG3406-4]|uniref:sucrase ferredoxin n=1 Tax=Nocardioides sp. LHG3406-4 TaxID=2804575 RepID=UPI003CF2E194
MTRCAAASLARGDQLAGTASTVRSFFLVEDPGPWGTAILRDSRLPPEVRTALGAAPGVRPLLIRRTGRKQPDGVRVFAVQVDAAGGWVESARLDSVHDVTSLGLASLAAGESMGLDPHTDPLVLVCTHGRHDACCAELGRPVALALAEAGVDAWECSHIGGDRFAGNLLMLPDGVYYGRVDPDSVAGVVRGHLAGRLDLDLMRGLSHLPMPVQAAEIAVRRQLGVADLRAVVPLGHRTADGIVEARFAVPGGEARVRVRTTLGPDSALLTCQARGSSELPHHEIVEVRLTGG